LSIYDKYQMPSSGESFKFPTPGIEIGGKLVEVGEKLPDANGDGCPVLNIETPSGDVEKVYCGPVNLLRQVLTWRPQVGDDVHIRFDRLEGQVKVFTLRIWRNGVEITAGQPPATTPAPALTQFNPAQTPSAGAPPWAGGAGVAPAAGGATTPPAAGAPPWAA